jgi:hypothetical protein
MKRAISWKIEQVNPGWDGGVFYELTFTTDDHDGAKIADALFWTMMQNARHAKFKMIKSQHEQTPT